ncbi:hypothetical protein CPB86DRAFT_694452 [Serendipita vermifera]|nr:hypothetical protein CPB86DRAFT_694452 [Serendipita vermifera]
MSTFGALPFDLLEPVLLCLEDSHPDTLEPLCLVNHDFNHVATKILYRNITIYHWYKYGPGDAKEIEEYIIPAISNCINLSRCRWTRDGTISGDVLLALQSEGRTPLLELEINGHSGRFYNPSTLTNFKYLTKLMLIMPDTPTARQLASWCSNLQGTLKELSIICQNGTTTITETIMRDISQYLVNLIHLSLTNCEHVGEDPLLAILRSSTTGLVSLSLEGMSPAMDWLQFSSGIARDGLLRNLKRLTLSRPAMASGWNLPSFIQLSEQCKLTELNLYNYADPRFPNMALEESSPIIRAIINLHCKSLQTLSLLRMKVEDDDLKAICENTPHLRKFFFSKIADRNIWRGETLSPLANLRYLEYFHITLLRSSAFSPLFVPSEGSIIRLVTHCSPNIKQCGVDNKVWTVKREFTLQECDQWTRTISLGRYDRTEIPAHFLVMRT